MAINYYRLKDFQWKPDTLRITALDILNQMTRFEVSSYQSVVSTV